ncbi:MAG: sigma-70 family RNA polymerase sigma factor, partial [Phycisphaerae bacterium]|nr:sigma-70 family RNA polymerase sigma factor [Phycisphaerae bacterium]
AFALPTLGISAEQSRSGETVPSRADAPDYQPSPEVTRELFEKAVALHSRRLLAIARAIVGYRASPEDVVQQAVMNLFQHRDRYDWREPGGLLKRAVVNESLRLLRPPKMTMVSDEQPDTSDTPVAGLIENETVKQVRAAIEKLPDHFRAALVLCEYENLSYVEIAQALDASVPQVKTWLHRARRKLAEMLGPYMETKDMETKGDATGATKGKTAHG